MITRSISKEWFLKKYEVADGSTGYLYLKEEALTRMHHKVALDALSALSLPTHPLVVDIGCACGDFASELFEKFDACMVVGLDFARPGLEIGKARYPEILFIEAALPTVPLRNSAVDLVLAMEILYYLSQHDREIAVANIWRITAPGGIVVVSINLGRKERMLSEDEVLESFHDGFNHLSTVYEYCLLHQKLHALLGRGMRASTRYRIPGLYGLCRQVRRSWWIMRMNYAIGRLVLGEGAKTKGVYLFQKRTLTEKRVT